MFVFGSYFLRCLAGMAAVILLAMCRCFARCGRRPQGAAGQRMQNTVSATKDKSVQPDALLKNPPEN